ncbi:MAG: hypothetical protein CMJ47_02790 [Planctomyces sp.]|nr:hypothetical protein [Planctomyces sp.]
MQILFINNDGAGYADQIDISEGTTINHLFEERVPHGKPQDYLIRVNRQPTTATYQLQPGDRVSMTPTKIEGADHPTREVTRRPTILSTMQGDLWERDNDSTVRI